MDRTFLDDAVLISVLSNVGSEKNCDLKFLSGKVIDDATNRFRIGRYLITMELEVCSTDVFLTKKGELFETSNSPSVIELSCAEFLLMRVNSFKLEQILAMRECINKSKLISAFDS